MKFHFIVGKQEWNNKLVTFKDPFKAIREPMKLDFWVVNPIINLVVGLMPNS